MLKAGLKRTDVECNWKRRNSTEIWLASKRSRAEIIRAVCRFRNKSSETGLDFKLIGAHILFSYLFWNSLCIKISLCAALRLRHKSWLRQNACLFVSATAHKSLASRCLSMRVCVRVLACTYIYALLQQTLLTPLPPLRASPRTMRVFAAFYFSQAK